MYKVLTLLALVAMCFAQQTYDCYPTSANDASYIYVAFQKNLYKYSKHDLKLVQKKTYNVNLCAPLTIKDCTLVAAGSDQNTNRASIRTSDLSLISTQSGAAPYAPNKYGVNGNNFVSDSNAIYQFQANNGSNYVIQKFGTNSNAMSNRVNLATYRDSTGNVNTDNYISNRIHATSQTCQYRGCTNLHYYRLQESPLRGSAGVELNNTLSSGCPTVPSSCGVPVLLSFDISNDIAAWVWSISDNGYKVYVQNYDAKCNTKKQVSLGSSLAGSTRCASYVSPSN
ncbi:hypothetical protein AKO1_015441 [Acrasis kona]|uniref:Uncharacterized protein n=1 Tax=Acrasis kona TaxID=1008807 RepID=A0AAW2YH91_9EUKA